MGSTLGKGPRHVLLRQLVCHWTSPGTQLSLLAPRSCRMQRGSVSPTAYEALTPGGTSGRVHLKSQRRWQQVSLERLEQDVAPKEVLVIYCNLAVSRRNGSSCHWIKTSQAERVGLHLCTGLLAIKLSRTGQFCNSSPITDLSTHLQVLQRWALGEINWCR